MEGNNGGKREGSSKGTCIKDPWTRTTGGEIECGRGVGEQGRREQWGEVGTTVIEQKIYFLKI